MVAARNLARRGDRVSMRPPRGGVWGRTPLRRNLLLLTSAGGAGKTLLLKMAGTSISGGTLT